ncbi:MAG: class I SAM-dependent methyltransferase [Clostridiales bacterium]|nr:class I SAM-dependent methyltransferase [Clostridiales bacterium]
MKNESLTLFIPLYGKALMSREGLFPDETAERIVSTVDYDFSKVDQSRKLAIYMAMRAAHYDRMVEDYAARHPEGVIIQLGAGLDSRVNRVQVSLPWYDLDFPEVIDLRRDYYPETERYHLIAAPALPTDWLGDIPYHGHALILAEGLSMYLSENDMRALTSALRSHFGEAEFIFDAYSPMAARLSRWKNPINAVDAKIDFAMDEPALLEGEGSECILNSDIITPDMLGRLRGIDRLRFRFMGMAGKKLYRIFGYRLTKM